MVALDAGAELAIVEVPELVLELDDATGALELGVDEPELELEDPDEELDDDEDEDVDEEPEPFFDDASGSVYC